MHKLIILFMIGMLIPTKEYICKATWYDTTKHKKIHRKHSTAAISNDLIKSLNLTVGRKNTNSTTNGSLLIVTNLSNNKIDTVEVTDVSGGVKHVDLSLSSFEKISKKSVGSIKVKVKKFGS